VRSTKAKGKATLYQHGNILDLVVYHKNTGNIFRMSEARMFHVYRTIPGDIVRASLLLFCIELLNKTQKEHVVQEDVYGFVQHALLLLDGTALPLQNYAIAFLAELSRVSGFHPTVTDGTYFLADEGRFSDIANVPGFPDAGLSSLLKSFFHTSFEQAHTIHTTAEQRKALLAHLLRYYSLHVEGFGSMQSPEILSVILHS
jgi:DNA repair protein RecO (recombination protein O)